MKKVILTAFLILTVIFIAACGSQDTSDGTQEEPASTLEAETTGGDSVTTAGTDVTTPAEESTTEAATEEETSSEFPVAKLTIAGTPISDYKVVLSAQPTSNETHSANQLVSYLEKATGVKLEITSDASCAHKILVGKTGSDTEHVASVRPTLGDEGYLLCVENGDLYITGDGPRGILYGVYSFLEDYIGCRFYTKDCERVLYSKGIDIPEELDFSFIPPVEYRNVYSLNAVDPTFSSKQKINGFPRHDLTEEMGGIPFIYGMTQNFVHTLGYLNNSDPEVTPCLSDETVYETVLENVRNYLGGHPEVNIISVSQCDNLNYCKCEKCQEVYAAHGNQPSATILLFVNRIADAIKDEFPDVLVDTLAYQYSMQPPEGIVPADNVMIRLCSIDCCMVHGFDECSDGHSQEFLDALKAWQKVTDKIYVWYYDCNYNSLNTPLPTLKTNMKNIRLLVQNGVNGFFAEGLDSCFKSGEFPELRSYLMCKMLWNPLMTDEEYYAYMDDFLEGYYGTAAPYIRQYIDATCDRAINWGADKSEDGKGTYHAFCLTLKPEESIPGQTWKDYAFSDEMLELWAQALAACPEGSEEWIRTDTSSIQMEYFYLKLLASRLNDKKRVKLLFNKMKAIETMRDAWNPLPNNPALTGKINF